MHLHIAIIRILRKALIAMWQGRCAKIILDKNCFRVPFLWLLGNLTLDMSTSADLIARQFRFLGSTESELHKDPASLINQ